MSDRDYTRHYFSDAAARWLATAYGEGEHPVAYPVGAQRVRLAMAAVCERLGASCGCLVDLGCGGGDLCLAAIRAGFHVVGVDLAPGMIEIAEERRRGLLAPLRERLTLRVADALASGLPDGHADALTALGLLEYLDGDGEFFVEAARLIRPGGVLVVSCRNRLFNMMSANDYTRREMEAGAGAALLDELAAFRPAVDVRDALRELVGRLRAELPALEEALAQDLREGLAAPSPEGFTERRRQHTPRALSGAAEAAGFTAPAFLGVHPHPLPPAFEAVAPRFYQSLAGAWGALELLAASLYWSSAFLAVFTRCPR